MFHEKEKWKWIQDKLKRAKIYNKIFENEKKVLNKWIVIEIVIDEGVYIKEV